MAQTNLIENILKCLPPQIDLSENFEPFPSVSTTAIHVGHDPNEHDGIGNAIIPPITTSTTFLQSEPGVYKKYDYSRAQNYSRETLETCIAALEGGKHAGVFSSGLAATNTVIQMLNSGDHIVNSDDLYGGTNRFFRRVVSQMNIKHTPVDMSNMDELEKAFQENTKVVWLETPSNPIMKMIDINVVAKLTRAKCPDAFVVVDNTFMTPYFQRPLEFGADMVVHSLTKYMNGHSDVLMGALITNRTDLAEKMNFLQLAAGAVPSPFDCYLANRGLKTLAIRMREHMKNGLAVARFLEKHPLVEKVLHPGLPSHPQYELGKRQMRGYSGMTSVYIKGGREEACSFIKHLKIFYLAESLGGFESLCEIPSIMTHASVPEEQRAKLGITDNMVRLSVGIEDTRDLLEDLDQALNKSVSLKRD